MVVMIFQKEKSITTCFELFDYPRLSKPERQFYRNNSEKDSNRMTDSVEYHLYPLINLWDGSKQCVLRSARIILLRVDRERIEFVEHDIISRNVVNPVNGIYFVPLPSSYTQRKMILFQIFGVLNAFWINSGWDERDSSAVINKR